MISLLAVDHNFIRNNLSSWKYKNAGKAICSEMDRDAKRPF